MAPAILPTPQIRAWHQRRFAVCEELRFLKGAGGEEDAPEQGARDAPGDDEGPQEARRGRVEEAARTQARRD